MPCFSPIVAYAGKEVGETGKRRMVFSILAAHTGVSYKLPCGQCIGCRLERSRQWAVRCMHEKMLHSESCFVTLTYDNEHMPKGATLVKRDLQLFMKRLRWERGDERVRFYACGEYGERTARPHYHLLLFGVHFGDRRFYKHDGRGNRLWTSEVLTDLWPLGFNVIGDVTFDSCAYVARYITKKITGPAADDHYKGREPEFTVMSRRPGIGDGWFKKFGEHSYKFDSVVMNGRYIRPPRFYDTRFEVIDSEVMSGLKVKRKREAMKHRADLTPERRRVREQVAKLALTRNRSEI